MSSLAYRRMNFTLQVREQEEARRSAAWYASLPEEEKAEKSHYWHIERKSKKGKNKKWIFVSDLYATKSSAAETFKKIRRDGSVKFRLRHILTYGSDMLKKSIKDEDQAYTRMDELLGDEPATQRQMESMVELFYLDPRMKIGRGTNTNRPAGVKG